MLTQCAFSPVIRLIGIDIDGTLLDRVGRLPEANRDAIRQAVISGVHVSLVTGRSYPFARPVAADLPPDVSLIVSNGAIERRFDGTTLARRMLDRGVAAHVLDRTRHHRDAAAVIFDRDEDRQIVFESMDWEHPGRRAYWTRNHSRIARAEPLEASLDEDPIQVMFNGGVQAMRALARELAELAGDFVVALTEYEHRDFSLVDITAPAATKGLALAWRAGQLGLAASEVMAIGDNFNDLGMLEYAGRPVVMGNAVAGLKTRGWHVTSHQDQAGVAEAIHRFVLRPPG
jgi:Cof subfamily protein (haloacid dehalogenase superfamily)